MIADGENASFDPRTWSARTDAGTAPAAGPVKRRAPVVGGSATAAAACAVLLLAGAGAAWMSRAPAGPGGAPAISAAPTLTTAKVPAVEASRRTLQIAGPAELAATLSSAGVTPDAVRAVTDALGQTLGSAPGQLRLVLDLVGDAPPFALTRMEVTQDDGAGATLTARPNGTFGVETLEARLTTRVKVVRGEMDASSFYSAAVAAGITDSLVSAFADTFAFDFDFQREIHPGDVFEAAIEQRVNPEGREVGPPSLIYASFTTPQKSRALYRFLAPGETEAGWYDGNGRSNARALLRTPVDGARISSQFGMRRHPVLGFMKLHKGTDFAAPTGTAIYAAGDATVEWAAMKGPNGNLTILLHDNGWETYYLHQSRFMPGVMRGARVRQGQEIGEVGTTGRSTGPHLHYEVHIDHQPVDPLGLDYGSGKSLGGGALAAFVKERNRIDAARAGAAD